MTNFNRPSLRMSDQGKSIDNANPGEKAALYFRTELGDQAESNDPTKPNDGIGFSCGTPFSTLIQDSPLHESDCETQLEDGQGKELILVAPRPSYVQLVEAGNAELADQHLSFSIDTILQSFEIDPFTNYLSEDTSFGTIFLGARWPATSDESLCWKKRRALFIARLARAAVSAAPWRGGHGPLQQKVLLAHISTAEKWRSTVWPLSKRDVQVLACCSGRSATQHARRLCNEGWLTRVDEAQVAVQAKNSLKAGVPCARFYSYGVRLKQLIADCITDHEELIRQQSGPRFVSTAQAVNAKYYDSSQIPTYGVFEERQGLGRTAEEVYFSIRKGSATCKEIASDTGRSSGTVYQKLAVLHGHNLIAKRSEGWRAVIPFDFRAFASELKVETIAEKRKQGIAAERRKYRRSIAR